MVTLSTAQIVSAFHTLVDERLAQAPLTCEANNDSMLNVGNRFIIDLFMKKISFNTSAVIYNLATTTKITSANDLLLINCSISGTVSASRDVILIGCHNHGKIVAGRNIHCYNSGSYNTASQKLITYLLDAPKEYHYSHGEASNITTFAETVSLVNFIVKGSINFINNGGIRFRGRVIMDKNSRIDDLEHTDAEIIRLDKCTDHKYRETSASIKKRNTPAH